MNSEIFAPSLPVLHKTLQSWQGKTQTLYHAAFASPEAGVVLPFGRWPDPDEVRCYIRDDTDAFVDDPRWHLLFGVNTGFSPEILIAAMAMLLGVEGTEQAYLDAVRIRKQGQIPVMTVLVVEQGNEIATRLEMRAWPI